MFGAIRRTPAIGRVFRLPGSTSVSRSISTLRINPRTSPRTLRASSAQPRPFHQSTLLRQHASGAQVAVEDDVPMESNSTKFQELSENGFVDKHIINAITKGMNITTMTEVQAMTIPESLKGVDMLAQAKTGTGKTLAFLVPVMQNILKQNGGPLPRKRYGTPSDIRALIISPTRELAEQIAVEARKICRSADTGIVVQTAVGGTQKSMGLRKIQQEGCHILVGTPGRLKDIFSDPGTGVKAPSLNSLVLDEADRLLDQGFSREIEEIVALLPDRNQVDRQTLLFSATIPREIMSVVRTTMKPDFQFVRTVREDEQPTHERVPQKMVNVGGFENLAPALLELCKREIAIGNAEGKPFKALVYLGATANVHLTASIFDNLRESGSNSFSRNLLYPTALIEIHSRLSQRERTIAADTFRKATSAILFSSDVTARGMDFPNVTHVIQLGVPSTREAYIHRIGRTARADKTGNGWLLHADLEKTILRRRLNDLPLVPDDSLGTAQIDMGARAQLPAPVAENLLQIGEATKAVDRATKASAYMSMLGIYSMIDPRELVEAMNRWSLYGWGLAHPPSIGSGLAKRLGISRVPGVNVSTESHESRGDDFAPRSSSRGAFGTRSSGRGDSYGSPRGASYGGRDYRGSGGGDRAGRPSPRRGGGSGYGDSAPYGRGSGGYGGERRSYPRDQHKAPRRSDY